MTENNVNRLYKSREVLLVWLFHNVRNVVAFPDVLTQKHDILKLSVPVLLLLLL
jgi:hypothetical protein